MHKKSIKTQAACTDDTEFGRLSAEQALQQMISAVSPITGFEKIPIQEALGRVLKQTIMSPIDVPGHTNSAVDGYAINSQDIPKQETLDLPIRHTVLAGDAATFSIKHGEAVRIMTGAAIPDGADTVIMQEHVEVHGNFIRIDKRHKLGQNVRQAGEDIQKGQVILKPGRLCGPADIGLIASLGMGEIEVVRRPRVAIFSTGSEIRSIGEMPSKTGIYDSNRYTLTAALQRIGADILDFGVISDNKVDLFQALTDGANCADIVITSGGVSVGAADYTKQVLAALGTVDFWKVAIKPGRPIAFGHIDNATFFGLPGNPVAVMVTYYQFVLPTLQKIMQITDQPIAPTLTAQTTVRIRKRPGRTEYQRGILEQTGNGEWIVKTTGKQGSGILRSMSLANAFIILPHEGSTVEPGDKVRVQPFAGLM